MFDLPGVTTSLIAAVIGATIKIFYDWIVTRRRVSGQRAILYGFENHTLFVFPTRQVSKGGILPRMATEDFLAINNLISAFISAGMNPPEKVRSAETISQRDKEQNNLILICSPHSNDVTREAMELLSTTRTYGNHLPIFKTNPTSKERFIEAGGGTFTSSSFGQEGPELTDIAVVIKAPNPWASQHKILIVSGIRGIGTWGVAEFLKKNWKHLHERKARSKPHGKRGDFAALVEVTYNDLDIKETKLIQIADL